ncbi:egg envelope glyco [Pelobates cultripes]|uniref:Egg envelope glyco, partial n=1 Tax=Pelobates cultripes TaxID=61616 RepID=A0AAD1RJ32_PELCU|nr:egg envelope glyco [Pelobates cultripes]
MQWMLFVGFALLCVSLPCINSASFPVGVYKTGCHSRSFWIWVQKDFLGPTWQIEIFNDTSYPVVLDDDLSAQCGYTKSRDVYGNVEVRISFLGCWVNNLNDNQFDTAVQFRARRSNGDITYLLSKSCQLLDPWNMREIICEENYMEVSVIRIVPLDRNWLKTDPQQFWPLVQGGLSQRWQVQFTVNKTQIIMSAKDAFKKGYGMNATATRVVFRTRYQSLESMILTDGDYHYNAILSIMYYTQALIRLTVNTTLACPNDPPVMTQTSLSWLTPAVLSPLVLEPSLYTTTNLKLGLNGQLIDANLIAQNHYTFQNDGNTVDVTVPIGAPGGYTESDIVNNTYGSSYRIHLFLEQEWNEQPADITRHTMFKPIVTPFQPLPPIFINYTIPENYYFNVSLGNFFPDVDLKSFIIKKVPLTVIEAKNMGFNVIKVPNANNTNAFFLQVPFNDPLVVQQYINETTSRHYTLYVTYVMTLLEKDKDFTYTEVVVCILADVVLPTYNGSCGADRLILDMTHGNLDRYWIPYIRNLPLTRDLAQSEKYVINGQGPVFHFEVPLFAVGLVYEDITLRGIMARLDWSLRDNKTLEIKSKYSVFCRFPTDRLLVCFPNGTVKATVIGLDTKPNFNPQKTHLKDPTCTPKEADDTLALFSFSVYNCGTVRKFDGDFLLYENEVTFDREVLPENQPIISRDSNYRLTLRCKYPVRDIQQFHGKLKEIPIKRGFSAVYRSSQARALKKREHDELGAVLRLSKDDTFTNFYQSEDFPVAIQRAAGLYFEVDVPRKLPGFPPAMLQECWATITPQKDGFPQWDLIANGCAKDGINSTTINLSPDSPPRFWVKMEDPISQIYVHCQLALHEAVSCQNTKRPDQETEKRSVPPAGPYPISVGPITIVKDNGVQYLHVGEKTWSSWVWILSVGLAVFVVFTIAAVSVAARIFVC